MLLSISLRKITVVTKKPTVETKVGCDFFLFWMLDVSQTASYEITLVRQSVCVSTCLSVTKFSQNWIISFFLILYMMIVDHDI